MLLLFVDGDGGPGPGVCDVLMRMKWCSICLWCYPGVGSDKSPVFSRCTERKAELSRSVAAAAAAAAAVAAATTAAAVAAAVAVTAANASNSSGGGDGSLQWQQQTLVRDRSR